MAGVSAGMLALTGFAASFATPASATSTFAATQVAGADRYATAAAIAAAYGSSNTVILASGEAGHFADALAANYLSGVRNAPILLTQRNAVPAATAAALASLGAKNVIIVGGEAAVSAGVASSLSGYTVTRIAGANRYATAAAVAANAGAGAVKNNTAILVTGQNFPDALAAGPLAYVAGYPILLTGGASLSVDAAAQIKALGITKVLIVGGTDVVSTKVEADLAALGGITLLPRLSGATRQDTAVAVANYEIANAGFSTTNVALANGANFPDALAGGPHAGKNKAPLLLTRSATDLGAATTAFLTAHANTLTTGFVYGGPSAVSSTVVAAATTAAKGPAVMSQTTRPELRSAAITGTVTTAAASVGSPAGTTVQYVFDEPVSSVDTVADFKLYQANGTASTTPTLTSVSGSTVTVLFSSITNDPGGVAATQAKNYSLATVAAGAVLDFQGQSNPDGSAGVGTASSATTVATANTTSAPDLRSVGGFRAPVGGTTTAIDFTFDQAAFVQAGIGLHVVLLDGTDLAASAEPAANTTAGGANVAGGNGTTKLTAIFPNPTVNGATPTLTANAIARAYVTQGSVGSDAAATPASVNPLESVNVTNGGVTTGPDLLSAQFLVAGTGANTTANDEVVYTFDQAVDAASATLTGFHVFRANGTQVDATAISGTQNSAGTQVLATFAAGSLTDAVGASVDDGAVTAARPDSAGVAPVATSSSSVVVGQVTGPQLAGVAIATTTDPLGNTTTTATYTFDKVVGLATGPAARFHLYDSNGNQLDGAGTISTPAGATAAANKVVIVTGFAEADPGASTNGASLNADVRAAVLGTVDAGAVTLATPASSGISTNPEGAAATTGSTGTPAS